MKVELRICVQVVTGSVVNYTTRPRLTGIKRKTFEKMLEILKKDDDNKKIKGGRKNKLSLENQLLLALEYIREYRIYFHISKSYGVSESTPYKTVRWVEDTLIKHPDVALPGRKALLKNDFRRMQHKVSVFNLLEVSKEVYYSFDMVSSHSGSFH